MVEVSQLPDEQTLVQQAQQGDKEAFAQLYESHFDGIYRYVTFKIGDRTEAEDVTQQVFINALKSIGSYRWKGTQFSAWLFRIAHNMMVDYYRKKSKRPMVPLNETITRGESDPQSLAEVNLTMDQLIVAAQKLTKAQREVLSLRFAADLPVAEVSRIMSRSEGAVKALQHSAVVALRKSLMMEE